MALVVALQHAILPLTTIKESAHETFLIQVECLGR